MKTEISKLLKGEEGFLLLGSTDLAGRVDDLLKAIEAALMCLDEGNKARAAQLLYSALPEERRQRR